MANPVQRSRRRKTSMTCKPLLLLLSAALIPAGWGTAAEPEVKIDSKFLNLTFKDIRYLQRSLDDFPKKKAVVLVFTDTSCPLTQRYFPTLKQLEKEYR